VLPINFGAYRQFSVPNYHLIGSCKTLGKTIIMSKDKFIQIASKIIENAESLFADAKLLDRNERKARAYTLYQLSIEEVGKAVQAVLYLVNKWYDSQEKIDEFFGNSFFRNHKAKTLKSRGLDILVAEVVAMGKREIALKILNESIEGSEKINELNDMKNHSLYTSVVDGVVKSPSELIVNDDLNKIRLVSTARLNAGIAFVGIYLNNIEEATSYFEKNPIEEITPEEMAKDFWSKF